MHCLLVIHPRILPANLNLCTPRRRHLAITDPSHGVPLSLSLSLSLGFIDVNVDFFNDDHDAQNIDDNDLRHNFDDDNLYQEGEEDYGTPGVGDVEREAQEALDEDPPGSDDENDIQDRNDRRLEVSLKVCSELIARNAGQCFGLSTTLQIPSPSYLRCSRLGWNSIHCGLE